jgi:soluble lytic murein transglycosylase-like protein
MARRSKISRDTPPAVRRASDNRPRAAARSAIRRGRKGAGLARLAAAILVTASFNAPQAVLAAGGLACEREMARAARANGIPLNVLYAVGLTETGHKGALNPFDMNVDGRTVVSASLAEALAKFSAERAKGARLIDIGCMQINERWHAADFQSLTDMFDPARNVRYAAGFLKELRQREGSWTLAVARYNAGPNNDAAQKKYVCAVIRNMVASGMGQWTPDARAFCQ